jgi:glycosyltransferase involved in cell wall biosynthesis
LLADPLVVVPDARFGGGGQAMVDAFLDGARSLGKTPVAVSPGYVPVLDSLNQIRSARALAGPARDAKSLWVVAAAASYGAAAPHSRRPYACWIATSLDDEWRGRVSGLSGTRRIAHAVNAPALRRIERRVLADATAVYGISPASRDSLARAAVRTDVGVLPLPVDLVRFSPEPDEDWQARLDQPTVVFVGRGDDPRKNVRLLLEAWPEIHRSVPEARLVLVGRSPAVPLPAGAEARGEVPEVSSVLRKAALFILPSLQEGFGLVAAEALACGVPVLSTPSGGPEQLLRESSGGRVLSGFTPDELGETAAALLGDVDGLARMRTAGRAYVEREHAPAVFRRRLDALLRETAPDA